MSSDPRAALATLVAAFERHLEVCSGRRGEDDPSVVAAYEDLADAFEDYDVALYEAYGEMTPLDIYGADDPDEDEDGDDEDGDDVRIYAGLDDVDFDDDEEDQDGEEDAAEDD